jgi:glycosyltransferase involved in cell wall biosynthesis
MSTAPLRICFLTYRGNPQCGGQGIYTHYLSRELAALGHTVDVWSGQPYPEIDDSVGLEKLASLDLWNEDAFFRIPSLREMRDPINRREWVRTITGEFPEPLTFTQRVLRKYQQLRPEESYDVVHDNQTLADGLIPLQEMVPIVETIHHPITKDRDIAIAANKSLRKRWGLWRWYSFIPMQIRVARQLKALLTVSQRSAIDIEKDFGLSPGRVKVVEIGVDLNLFRPKPEVSRSADRLVATISANAPLKGLPYLLEAFAELRSRRPSLHLTVIGRDGHASTQRLMRKLNLNGSVRFTGRVKTEEIIETYARSTIAVVPSLYEGFGLPAAEAMACQVPVVSTHAGALPEVIGEDGRAGVLVEPGKSSLLAKEISNLLDAPEKRIEMGVQGRLRVKSLFTWRRTAERTADLYRETIARRRSEPCKR